MEYQYGYNHFPVILGNEEETGMLIQHGATAHEPYELVQYLDRYLPKEFIGGDNEFLTNGFRIYPGLALANSFDKNPIYCTTNLERATPECRTPEQLAVYIRAGELLLRQIAINFAQYDSVDRPEGSKVRIQRRVVDSQDNRKGCHDNYSIDVGSRNFQNLVQDDKILDPVMRTFLASRIFLTGAGYVKYQDSVYFSQKMGGLQGEVGYLYGGTMARTEEEEPIEHGLIRFETRCNDINISDWATTMRIAGVALCLALLENGFDQELNKFIQDDVNMTFLSFKGYVDRINSLTIDDKGKLFLSSEQKNALSFQQYISELTMSKLVERVEIPAYYSQAAKETYEFYDDLNRVIKSQEDVAILANRADWAAKLNLIINKKVQKGRRIDSVSIANDIESCAIDLRYDNITVEALDGSVTRVTDGYGIKMRNRGKFKNSLKDFEIQKAVSSPPNNTRAAVRGEILSDYDVLECDWSKVFVYMSNADSDDDIVEVLLNPIDTQLSDYHKEQLLDCRKITKQSNSSNNF